MPMMLWNNPILNPASEFVVRAYTPDRRGKPSYFESVGRFLNYESARLQAERYIEQARGKKFWRSGSFVKIEGPEIDEEFR